MSSNSDVIIFGATSSVGMRITKVLAERGANVTAVSRNASSRASPLSVTWVEADLANPGAALDCSQYSTVICVAPIYTFAKALQRFAWESNSRVIALSSTSTLTKTHAIDARERQLASTLLASESTILEAFANATVLRPTMIHHGPGDRNIEQIVNHLRRTRIFPLVAGGRGMRQPIHADDVTQAVMQVLDTHELQQKVYEIAGAEQLSFKNMVQRVAIANQLGATFIPVPLSLARVGLKALSPLPRFRGIPAGALNRMADDMVFDNGAAHRDFHFAPSGFIPGRY